MKKYTNKIYNYFFFSSRKRHTRYWRDWGSDVCSSDLVAATEVNFHATTPILFHVIFRYHIIIKCLQFSKRKLFYAVFQLSNKLFPTIVVGLPSKVHRLFPLYGRRRFGGDVVANAVHTLHLINNVIAYLGHEVIRQMSPVGRHGVLTRHRAQCHGVLISTLVAHNSHATDGRKEHGAGLPHVVVKTCPVGHGVVVHVFYVNIIGFLQYAHLLTGDVAKYPDCQSGAGEGMTLDQTLGHFKLIAHSTHLIFEQPLQGFTQLELHLLG